MPVNTKKKNPPITIPAIPPVLKSSEELVFPDSDGTSTIAAVLVTFKASAVNNSLALLDCADRINSVVKLPDFTAESNLLVKVLYNSVVVAYIVEDNGISTLVTANIVYVVLNNVISDVDNLRRLLAIAVSDTNETVFFETPIEEAVTLTTESLPLVLSVLDVRPDSVKLESNVTIGVT